MSAILDNFLGHGKEVNVSYKSTIDRDESLLGYRDDNVLNTRMRLGAVFANASDGHRRELYSERPFYSLDARWMTGGQFLDQRRIDTMYDLGQEIDEFRHDIRDITIRGGVSRGIVDSRTRRWLFGVSSEEDTSCLRISSRSPFSASRSKLYPWIGWQVVADDFREMTELNDMGRTEDVALGINLFASIGFAAKSFGSDRDATLLRATLTRGWEAGRPGGLVQLGASTATRHEHDGFKNSVTQLDARYYLRNSENRLLSLSLSAARDARARSGRRGLRCRRGGGSSGCCAGLRPLPGPRGSAGRSRKSGVAAWLDAQLGPKSKVPDHAMDQLLTAGQPRLKSWRLRQVRQRRVATATLALVDAHIARACGLNCQLLEGDGRLLVQPPQRHLRLQHQSP